MGSAPERPLPVALAGRAAASVALAGSFFGAYYAIASAVDPAPAPALATALDAVIPFVPGTIVVYASVYVFMWLPLFVVRCPDLFRRALLAYGLAVGASLACHAAWPVSASGLRPPIDSLDPGRFLPWAVRLNHRLDPPTNLFPSAHLAAAGLAAGVAWKARRLYGAVATLWVLAVAVSVCTVKQHYVADAVAGLALAAAVFSVVVRPCRSPPPRAFGRTGPAAIVALLSLVYSAAYLAFRVGFAAS